MAGNNSLQPAGLRLPFYYGWFIVGLSFVAYLVASAIRSAPAVLIHPLEADFGWGRPSASLRRAINQRLVIAAASVGVAPVAIPKRAPTRSETARVRGRRR